jgi:hypothetical protein
MTFQFPSVNFSELSTKMYPSELPFGISLFLIVKGKSFHPINKFKSNLSKFVYFSRKLSNLNEKNSKFQIKLAKNWGYWARGLTFRWAVPWRGEKLACYTQILKAYEITFLISPHLSKSVGALKSFGPRYFSNCFNN